MTYYINQGPMYTPVPDSHINLTPPSKVLPAGTYMVGINKTGYYLMAVDPFHLTGKVYGTVMSRISRITNTFLDRPFSTGVILTGEKGSGKTMLAKLLSLDLIEQGISTIIVNQPFQGDAFNEFIQSIDQPTMVFFDEFEKVYDKDTQESLLTLFDGLFSSKKLFVVTCNDKNGLNNFFINRPGRFFYSFEYKGLEKEFIKEYLEDNLKNKSHIKSFINLVHMFEKFNFDMMKALVEEMNRYNEPVNEAMDYLNINIYKTSSRYEIVKVKAPEGLVYKEISEKVSGGYNANPYSSREIYIYYTVEDSDGEEDEIVVYFDPKHIISMEEGVISYKNDEGFELTIQPFIEKRFDARDLL